MSFCIQAWDVEGFDAFDGDGVGEFGDFFFGVHAFHGDPAAAVFQQVCRPVDEVGEFGEGAAGDDVGLEVLNGFDAAADDADVGESEFDDSLLQEGGFFGVGVQKGDVEVRTADGGGNAGLSAAQLPYTALKVGFIASNLLAISNDPMSPACQISSQSFR